MDPQLPIVLASASDNAKKFFEGLGEFVLLVEKLKADLANSGILLDQAHKAVLAADPVVLHPLPEPVVEPVAHPVVVNEPPFFVPTVVETPPVVHPVVESEAVKTTLGPKGEKSST
jgi:hypothetical protein